jgi:phosphohistidine phosphatase
MVVMLLYLVQHAEVKSKEEDTERDLTEKGRLEIENVAHHLQRQNITVEQIFHSGKTRAQSTAKVLAYHLQPSSGVSEVKELNPPG